MSVKYDAKSSNRKKEYREILIESIEDILDFSQVILNFLELNTEFKKERILENPSIFSLELEDIFGSSSSGIEELIIKRLYKKIQVEYIKNKEKTFSDYISEGLEEYKV